MISQQLYEKNQWKTVNFLFSLTENCHTNFPLPQMVSPTIQSNHSSRNFTRRSSCNLLDSKHPDIFFPINQNSTLLLSFGSWYCTIHGMIKTI